MHYRERDMMDAAGHGGRTDRAEEHDGERRREAPSRRWTVVLVDDEPDVRELVRAALLATTTWRVVVASSAAEARGLLGAVHADVLLVDDQMPSETGTELVAWLADQRAARGASSMAAPAILLTARRSSTIPRGAAGLIEKPFDPFTLATRVASIVAEHRIRQLG